MIVPNTHNRRSIRLKGYNYASEGLYFITNCALDRRCLFGEIINDEMILNDAGQMVENEWLALPERFTHIELHEHIVMPNHFHGILEINGGTRAAPSGESLGNPGAAPSGQPQGIAPTDAAPIVRAALVGAPSADTPRTAAAPTDTAPTKSIGDMMDAFKSITTLKYIRGVNENGWKRFDKKLWQRNYWEHIIRSHAEYERIANYIIKNPEKWGKDRLRQ